MDSIGYAGGLDKMKQWTESAKFEHEQVKSNTRGMVQVYLAVARQHRVQGGSAGLLGSVVVSYAPFVVSPVLFLWTC